MNIRIYVFVDLSRNALKSYSKLGIVGIVGGGYCRSLVTWTWKNSIQKAKQDIS